MDMTSTPVFPFSPDEVVLAEWKRKLYFAKILAIDHDKANCLLLFDDNSCEEVGFKKIHSVTETTAEIVCVICKRGKSSETNEIVLCDKCNIGFHQRCHTPDIPASALEFEVPWLCTYCEKSVENPHIVNPFEKIQPRTKSLDKDNSEKDNTARIELGKEKPKLKRQLGIPTKPVSLEKDDMISHDDFCRRYSKELEKQTSLSGYGQGIGSNGVKSLDTKLQQSSQVSILPQHMIDQRNFASILREKDKNTKSPLFASNDVYQRMLNEGKSQALREKQRLSEDLERQKRLLMEDIARNEQLRVEQIRRKHESIVAHEWGSPIHRRDGQPFKTPSVANYYWPEKSQDLYPSYTSNKDLPHSHQPSTPGTTFPNEIHHHPSTLVDPYERIRFAQSLRHTKESRRQITEHMVDVNHNRHCHPAVPLPPTMYHFTERDSISRNSLPSPNCDISTNLRREKEPREEGKSAFRIVGNNPSPNRPGSLDLHRKLLQLSYKGVADPQALSAKECGECIHSNDKTVLELNPEKFDSTQLESVSPKSNKRSLKDPPKANLVDDNSLAESKFSPEDSSSMKGIDNGVDNSPTFTDCSGNVSYQSKQETNEIARPGFSTDKNEEEQGDKVENRGKDGINDTTSEESTTSHDNSLSCSPNKQCHDKDIDVDEQDKYGSISELRISNVHSLRAKDVTLDESPQVSDTRFEDAHISSALSPGYEDEGIGTGNVENRRKRLPSLNQQDSQELYLSSNTRKKARNQGKKKWEGRENSPTDYLASQHRVAIDLPNHNWLVERLLSENRIPPDALKSTRKQENCDPYQEKADTSDVCTVSKEKLSNVSGENASGMQEGENQQQYQEKMHKYLTKANSDLQYKEFSDNPKKIDGDDDERKETSDKVGGIKSNTPVSSEVNTKEEDELTVIEEDQDKRNSLLNDDDLSLVIHKHEGKRSLEKGEKIPQDLVRKDKMFSMGPISNMDELKDDVRRKKLRDSYSDSLIEHESKKNAGSSLPDSTKDDKDGDQNSNRVKGSVNEGKERPLVPTIQCREEEGHVMETDGLRNRKRQCSSVGSFENEKMINPPPKLKRCSSEVDGSRSYHDDKITDMSKISKATEGSSLSERIKIDLRDEQDGLLRIGLSHDMKQGSGSEIDYASISDYATRMVNAELRAKSDKLPPPPGFVRSSMDQGHEPKIVSLASREVVPHTSSPFSSAQVQNRLNGDQGSLTISRATPLRPNAKQRFDHAVPGKSLGDSTPTEAYMSRFYHHHHHHHVHQHHGACGHVKQNGEQSMCNMHWDANCPHHGIAPRPDKANPSPLSPATHPTVEGDNALKKLLSVQSHGNRGSYYQPNRKLPYQDAIKDGRVEERQEIFSPKQNLPKRPVPTHPEFSYPFNRKVPSPAQLAIVKSERVHPILSSPHSTTTAPLTGPPYEDELTGMRGRKSADSQKHIVRNDMNSKFFQHFSSKYQEGLLRERCAMSNPYQVGEKSPRLDSRDKYYQNTMEMQHRHVAMLAQETSGRGEATKRIGEAKMLSEAKAVEQVVMMSKRMASYQPGDGKDDALLLEKQQQFMINDRQGLIREDYDRFKQYRSVNEYEPLTKNAERFKAGSALPYQSSAVEIKSCIPSNTLPGANPRAEEFQIREKFIRESKEINDRLHNERGPVLMPHNAHKLLPPYMPGRGNPRQLYPQNALKISPWNERKHVTADMLNVFPKQPTDTYLPHADELSTERIASESSLSLPGKHFSALSSKGSIVKDYRIPTREHFDRLPTSTYGEDKEHQRREPLPHAIDLSRHPTLSKTLDQISKQTSYPAANGLMNLALLARQGGKDQPTRSYDESSVFNGEMVRDKGRSLSPPHFSNAIAIRKESKQVLAGSFKIPVHPERQDPLEMARKDPSVKRDQTTNFSEMRMSDKTPRSTRYFSGELFKMLSEDRKPSGVVKRIEEKPGSGNPAQQQAINVDNNEREGPPRHCKICSKDAQFLCSGCRGAWYCSHECQIKEWKEHSKICKKASS